MIASRVAAELEKEPGLQVEQIKGGLGELSVSIDGSKVYQGSRIWYPTPTAVVEKVRAALKK